MNVLFVDNERDEVFAMRDTCVLCLEHLWTCFVPVICV